MPANVKVAWAAAGVLAVALGGGGYRYATRTASYAERVSGLQSSLKTLEHRIRAQEAREKQLKEQLDAVRKDVSQSGARRSEMAALLGQREKALEEAREQLDGANRELDSALRDIALLKVEAAEEGRSRAAEARRETSRLRTALNEASAWLRIREGEWGRARAADLRADLAKVRQELDGLRSRDVAAARAAAALRGENERLRGELQSFLDRVRKLEGASLEVRATRQSLQEKIGQLHRELEEAVRRKEREIQEIRASHRLLQEKLKEEIRRQDVAVRREKEHISIRLMDRVLFETASAELTERSRKTLEGVYEGLKPIRDGLVIIEGHADDRKIHGRLKGKYPSNWELSLARAAAVVRFLESRGMDPRRMAAAGYSYFRPLDASLTALGRSRNRRVEIKLIPPGFSVADGAPALMKQ